MTKRPLNEICGCVQTLPTRFYEVTMFYDNEKSQVRIVASTTAMDAVEVVAEAVGRDYVDYRTKILNDHPADYKQDQLGPRILFPSS